MEPVIGIDLGTTNSCVAIVEDERPIVLTGRGSAKKVLPSIVGFTEKGKRLVGLIAKRQSVTNAENETATFAYDFAGTLDTITYADLSVQTFDSLQVQPLVDVAAGGGTQSNPAQLVREPDIQASYRDQLNDETTSRTDCFGNDIWV